MRTVSGPTDHVVVVGAGLGGLSAALRLAGTGRQVTVLEREPLPGGQAGLLVDQGFVFDTGPTVLTMPELVADALACVGEELTDWLDLRPVTPAYRARFAGGSALDVHTDVDTMADEVARVCGPREAAGYRRLVGYLSRLYRYQIRDFIDRNIDSPLGLLTPNLARLVAVGGFRRLAPCVARYLRDPRTQRVFSFQALYAGMSPYDALALYAVIAYLDTVAGVWFPRGGVHAVPRALAEVAQKHGVVVRYGAPATHVETRGGRAVAVHTADERIPCDAVVLNPDLPTAWRSLLGREPRRMRYSPSCFVLLAGCSRAFTHTHHTLHFGSAWKQTFDELIDHGRLMSDPSFLVTTPTVSDPGLAPPGKSAYYVLFPTPNLTAPIDWRKVRYRDDVVGVLESAYPGFGEAIELEHVTTPLDWQRRGLAAGTPFAAAHSFLQTGPFRPANFPRSYENIVFAGSGTVPGVGVPMVLISGRLAAERITGPDRAYRSRAWPN
jgi:phytoene desaturase